MAEPRCVVPILTTQLQPGSAAFGTWNHADFFSGAGNSMILPRWSGGIHFSRFLRKLAGMWYSITLAMSLTTPNRNRRKRAPRI